MPNTKTGTTWAPDIRPGAIETFTETYTPDGGEEQTVEYKRVADHPILNGIRDIKAFFTTHVGAVWYNLQERKTLLEKIKEQDAVIDGLNANIAQKANASTVNTNLTNLSNRIASIENIQKNYVTGNQSGTVKFGTLLAKRKDQATVVFPKKFTKTPSISLSATSSSSGNTFLRATYASVNASSFVIQIENIDGALGITDVSVTWNAWV